jgi:putative ABC transport system permease protein
MRSVLQDLRYGVRVLVRAPGSTAVAILALALGIGANTAIFSLVDTLLLRPLPYGDAARLVQVWEDAAHVGFARNTPAPGNFFDWKAQNQVFDDMAASRDRSFTLTGGGDPEAVMGRAVTANVFSVLGVRPALGRTFQRDEDRADGPAVAIIGYGLWQRRFGGERDVVGRTVEVDGRATTIVGVMPRGFVFPRREHEVWVPMAVTAQQATNRNLHYLQVVARLRPGVPLERAQADMAAIAQRLERDHPDSNTHVGATVIPLRDELVGNIRPALYLLLAAVGCVLLIACANVANLLLGRATARRREIAVRLALGARRGRIVRQLLTESVLLSGAGGLLGLALAAWSQEFLAALLPAGTAGSLALDGGVLLFTATVSVLTGIVFGLAPAVTASRQELAEQLKGGPGGGAGVPAGRLRGALVVAEVALAFVLLAGAGLTIQAFLRVRSLDPGFRPEGVLTARTVLPSPRYADDVRRNAFYDQVLARVAAVPGVVSVGYTSFLPLTNRGGTQGFSIEGEPPPAPGEVHDANFRVVSPDYPSTVGMSLREGRWLAASDRADAPPVALVNEAFVARYFAGASPLGKRFKLGPPGSNEAWMTVVGVVGDVKQMGLEVAGRAEMYVPYAQDSGLSFFSPKDLAVRTAGYPMALAEPVRRAIWDVDPLQPVANVRPMAALLDQELSSRNLQSTLLGAFAALALVLASLGIYGVLAYAVAQRRREIGIRMALGAPSARVLGMVVGQGLRLCAIGIAIGVVLAVAMTRALSALLYGVRSGDALLYAAVAAVLAAVAAVASFVPARQAARVDPMVAIRTD